MKWNLSEKHVVLKEQFFPVGEICYWIPQTPPETTDDDHHHHHHHNNKSHKNHKSRKSRNRRENHKNHKSHKGRALRHTDLHYQRSLSRTNQISRECESGKVGIKSQGKRSHWSFWIPANPIFCPLPVWPISAIEFQRHRFLPPHSTLLGLGGKNLRTVLLPWSCTTCTLSTSSFASFSRFMCCWQERTLFSTPKSTWLWIHHDAPTFLAASPTRWFWLCNFCRWGTTETLPPPNHPWAPQSSFNPKQNWIGKQL